MVNDCGPSDYGGSIGHHEDGVFGVDIAELLNVGVVRGLSVPFYKLSDQLLIIVHRFLLVVLALPLGAALVVLPVLGVSLNGTSSVLYGTVAELVDSERRARAFGLFYSVRSGASALAPWLWGVVSDGAGVPVALVAVGIVALATVPLAPLLGPALRRAAAAD